MNNGHVNVSYGVDLTGATDSSVAFQQAVNFANDSGIKKVLLPKGTIAIGTKITSFPDIIFEGNGTVIKGINGLSKFMDASSRILFKNIIFDTWGFAVQTSNNNVNFENCKFLNISNVGVYYFGSKNSYVINCFFDNIMKSSIIVDNKGDNILIANNEFTNPTEFGGYSIAQTTAHVNVLYGNNVKVLNNKVFNNGGQGIIFSFNSTTEKGATNCKAIGNYCEGNGQEGITCFGGSNEKRFTSNNQIIGNTCKNNRFHQIEIWNSNSSIVNGNIVDESGTYGSMGAITLYGTNNSTCTGNVVINASSNGIVVLAGSKKTIVASNTIKGTNGLNDISTVIKGNGILLDSNGVASPSEISLLGNVIESIDTNKTSNNNKSGIYSTSQTNKFNTIENNSAFGYLHAVHNFAKTTCKNKSLTKPNGTIGYENGDYVEKVGTNEEGTAGGKYIVLGWKLIGGTWIDYRVLTGN